jgi:uncharacterized membrane protein
MRIDHDAGLDDYFADMERRAAERRDRRAARRRPRHELGWLMASTAGRALVGLVAAVAVATLVGLVALWPHGAPEPHGLSLPPTVKADVANVREVACHSPVAQRCRELALRVGGDHATLDLGPVETAPLVRAGSTVRVSPVPRVAGAPPARADARYTFVNVERDSSAVVALAVVAAFSLLVLRRRGLLAVVGVGISLLLLLEFVVPALLAGRPPLLVAVVGSLAVMFVTVTLTNGFGAQTMAAALGITATVLLAAALAALGIRIATLDGRSSDLVMALGQQSTVSLSGVVLAGMIIGALGVLADTAVTQASAVMALRHASAELSPRQLYRGALAVGRDHLSATIHTLVLAYAGAALPLLMVIAGTRIGARDALNMQAVAEPAIATAVGCLALIAAVPLTTGLAAALVAKVPREHLPHTHVHGH